MQVLNLYRTIQEILIILKNSMDTTNLKWPFSAARCMGVFLLTLLGSTNVF